MVDLGWPWWVTTLMAAGVALLAVSALARTRRATIRSVAVVVLLEAIGIAIIAPFVMEEADGSSGAPAMSSGEGTEFAQQADANCRRFGEFAASLGNPDTPAEIERQMDRFLPEFWRSYVAQQDLQPPEDEEGKAREWMHAMAAFGRDQESLRATASRRDRKAMERANKRANVNAMESARLSKELGMRVCFQ